MISFLGTLLTNFRMSLIGKDDLSLLDSPPLDCDWYPFGVLLDSPPLDCDWYPFGVSPSLDCPSSDKFLGGRDRLGFSLLIATFRVVAPPVIETFRFVVRLRVLINDFGFG